MTGNPENKVILDNWFSRSVNELRRDGGAGTNSSARNRAVPPVNSQNSKLSADLSRKRLATMHNMQALKPPGQETQTRAPEIVANTLLDFDTMQIFIAQASQRAFLSQVNNSTVPLSFLVVGFHDLFSLAGVFGMPAYEEALGFASRAIIHMGKPEEKTALLSSDKLLVMLIDRPEEETVQLADRIGVFFNSQPFYAGPQSIFLVPSIGGSFYGKDGLTWQELVVKGNQAADFVIQRGGNSYAGASSLG
ncbi:MAG: hypothetical protein IPM93_17660 [Candidatus Obscuribacter sp.]|nr:hypothetical protein [Candidatus Obscuribacter sp.]